MDLRPIREGQLLCEIKDQPVLLVRCYKDFLTTSELQIAGQRRRDTNHERVTRLSHLHLRSQAPEAHLPGSSFDLVYALCCEEDLVAMAAHFRVVGPEIYPEHLLSDTLEPQIPSTANRTLLRHATISVSL